MDVTGELKRRRYECLQHDIMKDITGEHFTFSTLPLQVILKLPNDSSYRLLPPLGKSGLVLFGEGVQVDVLLKL